MSIISIITKAALLYAASAFFLAAVILSLCAFANVWPGTEARAAIVFFSCLAAVLPAAAVIILANELP